MLSKGRPAGFILILVLSLLTAISSLVLLSLDAVGSNTQLSASYLNYLQQTELAERAAGIAINYLDFLQQEKAWPGTCPYGSLYLDPQLLEQAEAIKQLATDSSTDDRQPPVSDDGQSNIDDNYQTNCLVLDTEALLTADIKPEQQPWSWWQAPGNSVKIEKFNNFEDYHYFFIIEQAAELDWYKIYATALNKQKPQNKPLVVTKLYRLKIE